MIAGGVNVVVVCLLTYFTPTFFWVLSWRKLASGKGWPELLEWQWTGWRCDQWLSSAGRVWYRLWWRRKREVQLLWGCVRVCECVCVWRRGGNRYNYITHSQQGYKHTLFKDFSSHKITAGRLYEHMVFTLMTTKCWKHSTRKLTTPEADSYLVYAYTF